MTCRRVIPLGESLCLSDATDPGMVVDYTGHEDVTVVVACGR